MFEIKGTKKTPDPWKIVEWKNEILQSNKQMSYWKIGQIFSGLL